MLLSGFPDAKILKSGEIFWAATNLSREVGKLKIKLWGHARKVRPIKIGSFCVRLTEKEVQYEPISWKISAHCWRRANLPICVNSCAT